MIKQFNAIYFVMGHYNEDDGVPSLVGFDCPFDDSPVIAVDTEQELEERVRAVINGDYIPLERNERGVYEFLGSNPDVIVNANGEILVDLYEKITGSNPLDREYSFGRENLKEFWAREKWRWFG